MLQVPRPIVLLTFTVACCGCEGSLPHRARRMAFASVAGELVAAGHPYGPGWIFLMPAEHTVGDHVVVAVDSEGKFQTDLAPVGSLQIRVKLPTEVAEEMILQGRATAQMLKAAGAVSSPLRCRTRVEQPTAIQIDLATGTVRSR